MRRIILGLFAIVGAIICVAGAYLGRTIPFAVQWPLYESLRTTAAIIFAVVGAWLAIIYPERLRFSVADKGKAEGNTRGMVLLLTPAIHSTIILAVVLLTGIVAPLIKQIPYAIKHVEGFRAFSFVILSILTLWQICIVVLAIAPADNIISAADKEEGRQRLHATRNRLRQTLKNDSGKE